MNKNAILTGSEGFIGKFITKKLEKEGYKVIKIDKNKSNISDKDFFKTDLNSNKDLSKTLIKIKKKYDNVEVLINAAAIQVFSDFENRSVDEIHQMINVNLVSPIIISKFIYTNYFKKQHCGQIINIASIFGIVSPVFKNYKKSDRKSSETYGATKAGLIQLTKYFANYMSKYNVRVNCISPGGVKNVNNQKISFINRYSKLTASNRMAKPEEIVDLISFLISDKANYCNGQNFIIDGGYTSI